MIHLYDDHDGVETPPRAWGRQDLWEGQAVVIGNTPTGVGKTSRRCWALIQVWKHPHGRGEDSASHASPRPSTETPPRAWGRLFSSHLKAFGAGNTPTGVGKTKKHGCLVRKIKKHPHGRGEDVCRHRRSRQASETPPRAWGRRARGGQQAVQSGNTPTGVGKTRSSIWLSWVCEKHPHGRGEDLDSVASAKMAPETPPRAWGRPKSRTKGASERRNTPTGVGKTNEHD